MNIPVSLILAVLMVAGVATIGISLIAAAIGSNDTTQSDPHAGHDHEGHDHATENNNLVQIIPWAALGGVVVIGIAVLLIKCPEKIAKGLRVYKSEFKKVSWLSWKETKKSSLVVLGMLAAFALVICLLDLGLYEGLMALINKLSGLF